jgi:hypothetical protein
VGTQVHFQIVNINGTATADGTAFVTYGFSATL